MTDAITQRTGLILDADWLKPHSSLSFPQVRLMLCHWIAYLLCSISVWNSLSHQPSKAIYKLDYHYENHVEQAEICISLAGYLSNISNIVSILKFYIQLSHSDERVGSREKAENFSQPVEIMNLHATFLWIRNVKRKQVNPN